MGREHLRKLDHIVTVSGADSRNLQRYTGAPNVSTIPNGVDLDAFAPDASLRRNPDQVIFCGSLSFLPNIQAITWFVEKCWDRVVAARPSAKLVIIGKSPSPDLKPRLEAHAGVSCLGYVDDVRQHVRAASVSIAPMVTGSGIKNKILEAWSLATPVVATELAVRGLHCDNGKDILLGSSPTEFASRVVELLVDPQRAHAIGDAGRAHVSANYSWQGSQTRFRNIIEEAVARRKQPVRQPAYAAS